MRLFIVPGVFLIKGMLLMKEMFSGKSFRKRGGQQTTELETKKIKKPWLWCNIYTVSKVSVVEKIAFLEQIFQFCGFILHKKRRKAFDIHVNNFMFDIDKLLNVFAMIKLE